MNQPVQHPKFNEKTLPRHRQSGYLGQQWLSMINFIYYNHDDDNVNGTNDVDDIGPVNDENDLVMVEVGIALKAGEYPGEWMFFSVIGDDHVSVWDNSNKSGTAVSLPVTWQITGPSPGSTGYSTSHVYWVEGIKTSDVPHDVWFRTSYRGTDPDVTRYCWTTESNTVIRVDISAFSTQEGCFGGYAEQCTPGKTYSFGTGKDFIQGLIDKTATYGSISDIHIFSHGWVYQSSSGTAHNGGFYGGGPNNSGFYGSGSPAYSDHFGHPVR